MKNETETAYRIASQNVFIIITCVSLIPIVVNVVFVAVCFKVLRKKLHNLLVLSLCIGDSFLGFSLSWFCISKMFDFLRTSVAACLVQYFLTTYGLISTYSLIMIISLERYYVVKSLNFGVQKTFDRFKYLIIFGTLAFGLLFCLETLLFTHRQESIQACNLEQLYMDQAGFFITFMIGYVTILMAIIIYVSICTGYHIWVLFFKTNKNMYHKEALEMESIVYEEQKILERNVEATTNSSKHAEIGSKIQVVIEIMNPESNMVTIKSERERKKDKFKFDSWEVRAFITSIFIALTTIVLTGPLIISYWFDVECGFCLGQLKLFFVFPLEINSIINPFIYAWRIPEIRQEFKKFFRP